MPGRGTCDVRPVPSTDPVNSRWLRGSVLRQSPNLPWGRNHDEEYFLQRFEAP